jgi:cytidylate kinase
VASGERAAAPGRASPAVVTLAALYGAGGSVVGPRVAERLGVSFLDREIPQAVAKETGLTAEGVAEIDDEPRSVTQRVLSTIGRAGTVAASEGPEPLDIQESRLRGRIEAFLARSVVAGGVALGRGGAVVLNEVPSALHVFLGGPREARIAQAMALDDIERDEAEQRCRAEDRQRIEYVRRAYGVDGQDPTLYHLMLDSTALELEACVDLIVRASEARRRRAQVSEAA